MRVVSHPELSDTWEGRLQHLGPDWISHLKQLGLATLMYADDHENRLPHRGTHFVHWFSREFRDAYHRDYGIQRTLFYCPSNARWNRENFWNWPDGVNSVFGYVYYAGPDDRADRQRVDRAVPE